MARLTMVPSRRILPVVAHPGNIGLGGVLIFWEADAEARAYSREIFAFAFPAVSALEPESDS